MLQENNEQTKQLSLNPFIAREQQRKAETAQYGLNDIEDLWERSSIKYEAEKRILDENITDENEKSRIYEEIKLQYKEYKEYLVCNASQKIKQKEDHNKKEQLVEDKDAEFRHGYEDCVKSLKKDEELRKTKYYQGWNAAFHDSLNNGVQYMIPQENEAVTTRQEQSTSSLIKDELQEIREEMKRFDERLKRLERYTEE